MAAKKFYGVRNHPDVTKNGVYDNWDACSAVVKGAKGVEYRGFPSEDAARDFADAQPAVSSPPRAVEKPVEIVDNLPMGGDTSRVAEARRMLDMLQAGGVLTAQEVRTAKDRMEAALEKRVDGPAPRRDQVSVYVDGSYNKDTRLCGYGVYIQGAGKPVPGRGGVPEFIMCGSVPESGGGRNVEGEVTAAWLGLDMAAAMARPGVPIVVYHDYEGIGKWADGAWARNKDYTAAYAAKVASMRGKGLDIRFEHVKGHSGETGNELVDDMAKIGCGISGDYESFWKDYGRPFIAAGAAPREGLIHVMDVPVHLGNARQLPDVPEGMGRPDGQLEF